MNFISPHQEMMFNLFIAAQIQDTDESAKYFKKGLELLLSGKVDPYAEDNQLLREIKVRRWTDERCLLLSNAIIQINK
jgi:hypothetical protein